jgi:hypothetical protein
VIHIENLTKVPVGMFVGKFDELADAIDNEWAELAIPSVVFY